MTPVVLLVEDDPDHAELAARGLEGTAVELVVVSDLASARAWLATRSADLVLADARLPDGGAFDLLGSCSTPVVVLTSFGEEQAERAIRAGAIDYVVKSPEMFRELPKIVERNLRKPSHSVK